MAGAVATRRAPLYSKFLLVLAPLGFLFVGSEICLRRIVPMSGTTPFQPSAVHGLSHELKPSFTTLYDGVQITTNSSGFRGPEFPPPAEGRKRIAFVGDSVTFGNAIDYDDTFPALLEAHYRAAKADVVALDCGVPGYNIENVAAILEAKVLPLKPDLVVYVFVFNDVEVNLQSGAIPADARIDTLGEYPLRSATLQWLGMRGRALVRDVFGEQANGWVGSVLKSFEEGGRDRVRLGLSRIQADCASLGVPLLVAIYPHLMRLDRNPFRVIDEAAKLAADELKIPCVDLGDAFAPDEEIAAYWANPFDSHPNATANGKVANLLRATLEAKFGVGVR